MNRSLRPREVAFLIAVAVLVALPVGVSPTPLGASAHGAPVSSIPPAKPTAISTYASHPPTPVIPNCQPTGYPFYGTVNGVWPITPAQTFQNPCPLLSQDEEHATFFSTAAGSGERFTIPVDLATDSSNATQEGSWAQEYVGMIVTGNNFSAWRQSYAEVVFTPVGAGATAGYLANVHVFSMVPAGIYGGGVCPGDALNFSWNASYVCEPDMLEGSPNIPSNSSVPAGDQLAVTFAGTVGSGAGLDVWVNDSTTSTIVLATVLNNTNTGSGAFSPFYNSSCTDSCILHWAMPFGLGVGFTLCPMSAAVGAPCDSYNETRWRSEAPPQFGIPEFYSSGSYSGDYLYFAPQSDSGVCNSNAAFGQVATCYSQLSGTGTGYYPSFTYNGSQLAFGANFTWTTQNWGGAAFELLSDAAQHDLLPFYAYASSNTSRAGFVASAGTIGVTVDLQDLGSISSASLSYGVNGATPTVLPLSFANGSRSDANYTATIPTGPDGEVNYTITAVNGAGATIVDGPWHVARGPLPTFHLTATTQDMACATIVFNGTSYSNGSVIATLPGYFTIHAQGCYPWVFSTWSLTRGLSVAPFGGQYGTIEVTASGTILALWHYVRPFDSIYVATNPGGCGQVILNGSYISGGGPPTLLLDAGNYSIGHIGCGGEAFGGWTVTSNLTVLGSYLTILGNGTLTANYITASTASSLIFATNPTNCGGVLYNGAGYVNNENVSIAPGNYPIAPDPCSHWGWRSWGTTGGLSVSGSTLTVTGGGVLTENNYVLTEITFVTNPPFCGNITFDGTVYRNGDVLVVANNSTGTVFASACAGYYLFAISGTGGIVVVGNAVTINGSGEIIATFIAGTPTQFLGFLTDPSTCGSIVFDGVPYVNSNYTYVAPGRVATLSVNPCNAYGFVRWITYGFVTVVGATAYLNGSGALEAVFRPLAAVFLYTSPQGCGSINVAGTNYSSNSSVELTEFVSYSLAAYPCKGYQFSGWVNTTDALLAPGTLTVTNQALLTADFSPIRYAVTVDIFPATCGSVRVNGANDINGTVLSLAGGIYSVAASPCLGNHLVNWTISGNLAVAATTLYVNGSGTLGADYEPVAPTVSLYVANQSFVGLAVPLGAAVAVPVPPYTYNWTWDFGDGSAPTTTPVNFTSHVYQSPGSYVVTLTVTDPIHRTANATSRISIVAESLGESSILTPLAIGALAVGVIAVALAVVLALRRPRPPADPSASPPSPSESVVEPLPTPGGATSLPEETPKA